MKMVRAVWFPSPNRCCVNPPGRTGSKLRTGYAPARSILTDMEQPDQRAYESALRRLPEAHSLLLRLRDAGVADDVVCGYLHIEPEGLDTMLLLAQMKLDAELTGSLAGPRDRT
jgi:hypothetical protein